MTMLRCGRSGMLPTVMFLAAVVVVAACGTDPNVRSTRGAAATAPDEVTLGPAPEFSLRTTEGGSFTLSEHDGRVVVVNFWATWCAPCLEEMPGFVRLQETYGVEGLQFVGISVDDDDPAIVESFAARLGVNYPITMDDGIVSREYKGHLVIPSTFVIDRDGLIRSRYIGLVSFEKLVAEIESLLDRKPDR